MPTATPTPAPDTVPTGPAASHPAHPFGHPSITIALSLVMEDVGAVGKDGQVTSGPARFSFRGVDAVVNAVSPALRRHGVVVAPKLLTVERSTSVTKGGGTVANVYVVVRYRFHGPAGDHLDATVAAESFDSGDKATAKAMSVAYRTALLQALCLPTDDPTDPDEHQYERGPAQPVREPVRATAAEARASRPRQEAPNGRPDLPPATAMAFRQRAIDTVHATAAGSPEREAELRALYLEVQGLGGVNTPVPVPEPWQRGRGETAPLGQLILACRGERARAFPLPGGGGDDDPWATPGAGVGEEQGR